MCELKKMERYLRVNLLGPGPRLMKKRIYRAAVSQRLRNTGVDQCSKVEKQQFCRTSVGVPAETVDQLMILSVHGGQTAAGECLRIVPGTSTRYTKLQRVTTQYNAVYQLLLLTCLNGLRLCPGKSPAPQLILYSAVH